MVITMRHYNQIIGQWEENYQAWCKTTNPVNEVEFQFANMAHMFSEGEWRPDDHEFVVLMAIACGVEEIPHTRHLEPQRVDDMRELAGAIARYVQAKCANPEKASLDHLGKVLMTKLYEGKVRAIIA
jgi:hypothetical protein